MSSNVEFSKVERSPILLQSALIMFVLLFWKYYQQELYLGDVLQHALLFFACGIIIVLMHESGHKFMAQKLGYTATVTQYNAGLLASTVVIFFTFARIPLIIANPVELDADSRKRLGKHRQYENPKQYAFIVFAGIIGSTIAIAGFQLLANITGTQLFSTVAVVAGIHAISSLIPWELFSILVLRFKRTMPAMTPGDGLLLLRWQWIAWVFAMGYIISFTVLSTTGSTLAFVLALAMGGLATLLLSIMKGRDQ